MDNVSFTSRINFVDKKTFENFRKGTYIDFRPDNDLSFLDLQKIREIEKESL